jgi:hypothetical protein
MEKPMDSIRAVFTSDSISPHTIPLKGAWYRIESAKPHEPIEKEEKDEEKKKKKEDRPKIEVLIRHLDGSLVTPCHSPWLASKNQGECLASVFGDSLAALAGKLVYLICDPQIPNPGGGKPGGIRITGAVIPADVQVKVKLNRSRAATYTVSAMPDPTAAGPDPLLAVAAERGEALPALEASIAAAIKRPIPTDHAGREKAAAWARSEKGRAALAAANPGADAPQHGD